MSNPENKHLRAIRSFVTREGRMTPGQQKAIDNLWPTMGINHSDQTINWEETFNNSHPVVIEIGFGMGHSLAEMAVANPDINYVGIEVHRPGVGTLLKAMGEQNIQNLRLMCHDAVEVLDKQVADNSIDGFQIFFPDPWHKARHHKRRLIQAPFIEKLIQKIKPGGFLHCATDWENYAEQIMEVLSEFNSLENSFEKQQYAADRCGRPITKFERRGERLGHGVWDLYFKKK